MNVYIAVAIGGAIGAMMRYGVSQYIVDKGVLYPWGTVVVNLLGSLLIGFGMVGSQHFQRLSLKDICYTKKVWHICYPTWVGRLSLGMVFVG